MRTTMPGPAALDDFNGALAWPALDAWIQARDLPGSGPITDVRRLSGGLQNQVFLLDRGGVPMVLRRPPANPKDRQNDTMRREARVLRALEGTEVPHPRFYALGDDPSVIGATFYLMEPLEGFAPIQVLRGGYATDSAWRHAMGGALVGAATALAAVDVHAAGLDDLGKPQDWHERQVARWRSQLEGYAASPGYNPADLPHVEQLGRWLTDHLPSDRRIGLIHGDLQFANVMFSLRGPVISGVIDWELASLGDPLLDLGWILASWSEEGDPPDRPPLVAPWDNFISRDALIRLYGERSGRDTGEIAWFFALACYKLATLLEGTTAAAKAGKVPADIGEKVHGYATWLMEKGRQIIAG